MNNNDPKVHQNSGALLIYINVSSKYAVFTI